VSYPLRKPGRDQQRVPPPYTGPPPPPPYTGPPSPPSNGRRRTILIIAGTAAAVAIIVLLVSLLLPKSSNGGGTSGGSASGQRSSTSDQWYAAVCKPGTFIDGNGGNLLPNSIASTATCISTGPAEFAGAVDVVVIGTYSSTFKLQNDMTHFGGYATIPTNDGNTEVFAVSSRDPSAVSAALNPLTQIGYTIHSAGK